jgi:hypothetical protein
MQPAAPASPAPSMDPCRLPRAGRELGRARRRIAKQCPTVRRPRLCLKRAVPLRGRAALVLSPRFAGYRIWNFSNRIWAWVRLMVDLRCAAVESDRERTRIETRTPRVAFNTFLTAEADRARVFFHMRFPCRLRGEGGRSSRPGEGDSPYAQQIEGPPHPTPLPAGEREPTEFADGSSTQYEVPVTARSATFRMAKHARLPAAPAERCAPCRNPVMTTHGSI